MKIRVCNYQRHADSTIEVGPGVTSLIGRSDHGKSSIVRSISWCQFDRPLGTAFVRKGQSKTVVAIDNIEHIRTKTKNYYQIDGELAASKKAQDLLNINAVNIQEQLDPPFLLKESPGERARKLALLIDLTKPQDILRELKAKGSKLNSKRDGLISIQKDLEERLSVYGMLNKYKRSVAEFEAKTVAIQKQYEALATLAATIEIATETATRLDTMPNTEVAGAQCQALLKGVVEAQKNLAEIVPLSEAIMVATEKEKMRIPDYSNVGNAGASYLKETKDLLLKTNVTLSVGEFLGKLRKLNVCMIKAGRSAELLADAFKTLESIDRIDKIEKGSIAAYRAKELWEKSIEECACKERELEELRASIGICPFCGRS